jgi:hypothetical protein
VIVYPYPAPQGILQNGDTLFANAGAAYYQWFLNGNIINGATDYFYVAISSGDYNVVATDANGCEVEAVINNVVAEVHNAFDENIVLFPNPVIDELRIKNLELRITYGEISVYNMIGEKIEVAIHPEEWILDCRPLPAGIYFVEIISNSRILRGKFLKR